MTLKMFALQGLVSYGALTLSAFVYIPFGQAIMDTIVKRGFFAHGISQALQNGDLTLNKDGTIPFEINPNRMHAQLFAVLTTSQVINAATEVAVPYIMRKVADFRESKQVKEANAKEATTSVDGKFLSRVKDELELPPYDTFADYAEMAVQFGFVTLWSVIWPLAPVMAFVNNFFELRSDALKISINARRPVPERVESIGPWLEVLVSGIAVEKRSGADPSLHPLPGIHCLALCHAQRCSCLSLSAVAPSAPAGPLCLRDDYEEPHA